MSANEKVIEVAEAIEVRAQSMSVAHTNTMLQLAIEKNVDVDLLERLVALREREEARNARAAYFEALAAFQEECPEIRKSKTAHIVSERKGTRFKYTYAPLEEITRTIRPILRTHGLSYNFDVEAQGGSLIVSCVLRHVEGHSEKSSFPVPIDKGGRMSDAQANGAALTYGRRQSLIAVLGLTTADQDVDGVQGDKELEFVTEEQAANISDLCDQVGPKAKEQLLAWLGVTSIAEILSADFQKAVDALNGKLERRRA